ncbi:hypothetical protein Lcho_1078 [Leptothrix cholodnii SP-6]|uniref:Uncharacterized protein n=1 Tax=Leptothrix cholodnii (strain ATCC 51168 / LMG 8142 / SP-6) TaxID=395495 RepID=B1Y3V3_LEPCP|nr:hypothetical protein [Leptothrix cholodnii]ACB33347.1 hypothetical protein Lcho_1078 [Leptothrix cholodnii SP-6]
MTRSATRCALLLSTLLSALPAAAHEGHGLPGISHWHSGDASLYLFLAVFAGAIWLARRK